MFMYFLIECYLSGYFCINQIMGVIMIVKDFDRENMIEFVIYVQVIDSVNLMLDEEKIVIKVDDVNDCVLVFIKVFYMQDYREELLKGISILIVVVMDVDMGRNVEIRFSIVGNVIKYVVIDFVSGFIFQVDNEFDCELLLYFNFIVFVIDLGFLLLLFEVEVFINLVDINDNSLIFNKIVY